MISPDKLPEQVFGRLPLAEERQILATRPSRLETITVYNNVMARFMQQRQSLLSRYDQGGFEGISEIVSKNSSKEAITDDEMRLARDYGTLIHSEIALYSRNRLNVANFVERAEQREANGQVSNIQDVEVRGNYQIGRTSWRFSGTNPLDYNLTTQRYVAPAGKDNERDALRNGARVDGLIRMLDEEISMTPITNDETRARVNRYRRERAVLWTQSRAYWDDFSAVAVAQENLDAYFSDKNPMLADNVLKNWLNGEKLGRSGRILMIPSHPRMPDYRWGCLPLLLLLPIPILTQINSAPCAGTGGELQFGVFDVDPRGNSEEGANAQTIGYFLAGIRQNEARSDTDPDMHAALAKVRGDKPGYYEQAQGLMHEDHMQTASRLVGHSVDSPFIRHEGFNTHLVLPNCLSPQEVDARVNTILERRNNPQWYDGIAEKAEAVLRWLPKFSVHLR